MDSMQRHVLEGSVVMQLKGGQQVTLTPGQSFYEGPDDVHVVDRNKRYPAGEICVELLYACAHPCGARPSGKITDECNLIFRWYKHSHSPCAENRLVVS